MEREVRWERMFPDELEAAFAAAPVLYMPYGLCEPHGPQNALGLDALKAHAICRRAARGRRRHRRPAGLLAHPRGRPLCRLGAARGGGGGAEMAHRGAAVDPLQERLLPHPRRRGDRLPCRDPVHRPLRAELAGPEDALRPDPAAGAGAALRAPRFRGQSAGIRRRRRVERRPCRAGRDLAPVVARAGHASTPAGCRRCRSSRPATVGRYFAMGRDAHQASRRIGDRMVADEVAFLTAKAAELLAAYDRAPEPAGPRLPHLRGRRAVLGGERGAGHGRRSSR